MQCARKGCPGNVPNNRQDVRHCSKLCADVDIQQNKLGKLALRIEREGIDMTSINERWDALERVATALSEYRSVVMRQYGG